MADAPGVDIEQFRGQRATIFGELDEEAACRLLYQRFNGRFIDITTFLGFASSSSISHRMVRYGLAGRGRDCPRLLSGSAPAGTPDPEVPLEEPAFDESYWQRRASFLERECVRLRETYLNIGQVVTDVVREYGVPRATKPYILPRKQDLADEELSLLFLADVHVGEEVLREQTAGISTYSTETFIARCDTYKRAVSSLIDGHLRRVYPLRKAFMPLLGDMCTGEDVFPMQLARTDRPLMTQIVEGAWHISEILRFVAGMYEEVYVYGIPGNHGATKTTTLNSDTVMYVVMAALLRNQPNLHFILSDSEYCGVYLDSSLSLIDWPEDALDLTWNLLFAHGHQTRGWAGIPYYGLDRLRQRITGSTHIVWDRIYTGHFHQDAAAEGWHVVGSWMGGTDFSVGKLQKASRPTQLLQGLHPKRGFTWTFPIYLGDEPHLDKDSEATPGMYTPHNALLGKLWGEPANA